MALKKHDRTYDLVILGATGYTGQDMIEVVMTQLPTTLKWAVAGRSYEKMQRLVTQRCTMHPDRNPPSIEVCDLTSEKLAILAKKTQVLITTVGPYGRYGESAFKACAENGTAYVDVSAEPIFTSRMVKKYEQVAKDSGAAMFPQAGLASVPADLVTWALARTTRTELSVTAEDITLSVQLPGGFSSGTLESILSMYEEYTREEVRHVSVPFNLSPVPNPSFTEKTRHSLIQRLTGIGFIPDLGGYQAPYVMETTDRLIVERSWGLLSNKESDLYGPRFNVREFVHVPTLWAGIMIRLSFILTPLVLSVSLIRSLIRLLSPGAPGTGPDKAKAAQDLFALSGVASAGGKNEQTRRVFCRMSFTGGNYRLTAVLAVHAAFVLLQNDVVLGGGIFTPAVLGQRYIDSLESGGVGFDTKVLTA